MHASGCNWQEHADAVWRTVIRLLGDVDDARDCFQQAYMDAVAIDPSGVENWRGLLCRIATRRAMDLLRRRYRNRETVSLQPPDVSYEPDPAADLHLAELRESVRVALAELPEKQAEAFWLRHIEGLSGIEIAEVLGLTAGNVRVLVHRTTEHLRLRLGAEFSELVPTEEKQ